MSEALKPPPPQRYPLPRPGRVADPESAAVGSRTEYAFAAPPEILLAIAVFAVRRVWIKLSGEDSAAVSPWAASWIRHPFRPIPSARTTGRTVKRLKRRDPGDPSVRVVRQRAIPCWVPVARAPATVIGLTGGITANGVGTFAGPVDQPWVVLP